MCPAVEALVVAVEAVGDGNIVNRTHRTYGTIYKSYESYKFYKSYKENTCSW